MLEQIERMSSARPLKMQLHFDASHPFFSLRRSYLRSYIDDGENRITPIAPADDIICIIRSSGILQRINHRNK